MSTHPYIPLYVDDYDAATAHLTVEEDGAYSRLIRLCWRTPGCSLPNDEAWIARKIRMSADDFARIAKPVLDEFFTVARGRLIQKRLKREYDDISRKKSARKLAGKKGGEAKARKEQDNSASNATGLPPHTGAFPEPNPEPEPVEEPPVVPQGDKGGLFGLLPAEPLAADPVREAFDAWNNLAKRCGLPIAEDLTDKRRRSIKARIEGGGLPRWTRAMQAVEASAFCLGQSRPKPGEKAFKASLDFVLQASSFQKLIEGNYGQDAKPVAVAEPVVAVSQDDVWRRRVKAFLHGSGFWNSTDWEAQPGRAGCIVPPSILREFGIEPARQHEGQAA